VLKRKKNNDQSPSKADQNFKLRASLQHCFLVDQNINVYSQVHNLLLGIFFSCKIVLAALAGLCGGGERTQHFLPYAILFDASKKKVEL